MSEAEVLDNPALLLEHVRSGELVVIDGELSPIAMVRPPEQEKGPRTLSATLAILEARAEQRGESIRMGQDFADDLEEIIANRKPSRWSLEEWD